MFINKITTMEELRSLYGQPGKVSLAKERPAMDQNAQAFVGLSPFVLIATADSEGRCDVSPKGDKPGFVRVIDEKHLLIPDRPGNNRLDSLANLIANPRIGLLFLIPGRGDTLRVNGKAWIVSDDDLLEILAVDGKRPRTAIGVEAAEVYLHCPKAFMRSGLWNPQAWPPEHQLPGMCEMLWNQLPEKPDGVADLGEYEAGMRERLEKTLY
ncbi:MAG: pyridoxamine 5'-phosphate oxidase family protein [Blastocatellia bacterium]